MNAEEKKDESLKLLSQEGLDELIQLLAAESDSVFLKDFFTCLLLHRNSSI